MQAKRFLTTAALVVAAMLLVGGVPAANAQDYFFRATSGNSWSTQANWYDARTGGSQHVTLPGTTAYVEIVTGNDADIDTADREVARLDVISTATLDISAGRKLSLNGSNAHTIDGTLSLLGSGTATLHFKTNSVTVDGSGSIDGQDNGAKIELATDIVLTSTTTIEGRLQVLPAEDATGTRFINNGAVDANDAGTLQLNVHYLDTSAPAGPSGTWRVGTNSSAILQFSVGSILMSGAFTVSDGKLDVDQAVTTTANLTFDGGIIDVAASTAYQAS